MSDSEDSASYSSSSSCESFEDNADFDYTLEPKFSSIDEKNKTGANAYQKAIPEYLPEFKAEHKPTPSDEQNGECPCGMCILQPGLRENGCCHSFPKVKDMLERTNSMSENKKITCITEHPEFLSWVYCEHVLKNCYRFYRDTYGGTTDTNAMYRYVAYRNYTSMVHGTLGTGRRIPLPACAYARIRGKFPSVSYTGFSE